MENKINHGHKFAEREKIKTMTGFLDKKKKIVHRKIMTYLILKRQKIIS